MNNDLKTVALTLYGEVRGEIEKFGNVAGCAILWVIYNRLKRKIFGATLADVCLKPFQFSCWNVHDPNFKILHDPKTLETPLFFEIDLMVQQFFKDSPSKDFTQNATHYHCKNISKPFWAKEMSQTLLLGNHVFYRE